MNTTRFLSTFAVLGLAASVTAGSMYVSVRASSVQESEATPVQADVVAETQVPQEVVEQVKREMNAPLPPEKLISDRSHDVVLAKDGSFSGQLSSFRGDGSSLPASGLTVKVVQDGVATGEVRTTPEGKFSFTGQKPGVAALLAYSNDSFLLFGIRLVASDEEHPATMEIDIQTAVVVGGDMSVVKSIINSQLTNGDVRFSAPAAPKDDVFPFGKGDTATSVAQHRVQLQEDGSLKGFVNLLDDRTGRLREILDLTVYFVRGGKVVEKVDVENNGEFVVQGLEPGVYSVVGVGEDGTLAFGVEILPFGTDVVASMNSRGEYQTVAVLASLPLGAAPANAANFNKSNAAGLTGGSTGTPGATGVAGTTPPAGGTGGTGGGSPGGGGAGGGDGLGALLAGAAGAAAGFALADDDTPASPGN